MTNPEKSTMNFVQEVIGYAPNNHKKSTNGLDEIDQWAAGIGQSERKLNSMRPRRRRIPMY